jgi:hypothetical protein
MPVRAIPRSPSARRRLGAAFDLLVVFALIGLAASERLPLLDLTIMGSDGIGPFRKAQLILQGGSLFPNPHVPESGYAFYWLLAPIVATASSLREALVGYFLLDATTPALVYLGARMAGRSAGLRRGVHPPDRITGSAIGLLAAAPIALEPKLVDSVQAGAHGYLSAWAAAVLLLAVLAGMSGRCWGAVLMAAFLPVAAMIHPFLACTTPALLWLLWRWWRHDRSWLPWAAIGLGLLVALPQLVRLLGPLLSGAPQQIEALRGIAEGNGRAADPVGLLVREGGRLLAYEPVAWTRLRWIWLLSPFALFLTSLTLRRASAGLGVFGDGRSGRLDRERLLAIGALLTAASFGGMVVAIGYVQQWHFRLFLPLASLLTAWLLVQLTDRLASAAGVLLGLRSWALTAVAYALLLGMVIGPLLLARPRPQDEPGRRYQHLPRTLAYSERVVDAVASDDWDGLVVLELLQHRGEPPLFEPASAALDLVLRGFDRGRFAFEPAELQPARYYTVIVGSQTFVRQAMALGAQAGARTLLAPTGRSDGINEGERVALMSVDGLPAFHRWFTRACSDLPGAEYGLHADATVDYLALVRSGMSIGQTRAHLPPCVYPAP